MNHKILVAAEDYSLRTRLDGLLNDLARDSKRTYTVTNVSAAVVAQYQMSRTRFDLVVIALRPSGGTLDLLLRLREDYPALPILLLRDATGYYPSEQLDQVGIQSASLSAPNGALQQIIFSLLGGDPELLDAHAERREPCYARGAQPSMNADQRAQIQQSVRRLERSSGVELVLVADGAGEPIAHWAFHQQVDVAQMAVLAATTLATTVELNHRFGGTDVSSLVIKEIAEQTVLIARADTNVVILIVLNRRAPLGWGRILVKRLIEELRHVVAPSDLVAYLT